MLSVACKERVKYFFLPFLLAPSINTCQKYIYILFFSRPKCTRLLFDYVQYMIIKEHCLSISR